MKEPRHCCQKHWAQDAEKLRELSEDVKWFEPVRRMIVCPVCGDKRCPAATDCSLECTGDEPKCEACGVPLAKHLGATGTCQRLQDSLAREVNYREQIEALLDERDAALARLAVKCEHPEASRCAKLWAADNERRHLEAVDPKLADEFPFGCDTVEHLAVALLAARAGKARAT